MRIKQSSPSPLLSLVRRTTMVGLAGCAATAMMGACAVRRARADPGNWPHAAVRAAAGFDQLHALVIARQGQIVLAEALRGPGVERPVNVKSVSKTVHASITGAAIDRDFLAGTDVRVADIVADLVPADADPRVYRITIADLLTMQAGLERTSGANYGRWVQSANWAAFALGRPFVAEPGARMLYSTGSYHLLGVALARLTGRSLLDLARDWLGEPLGIEIRPWTRDPQGYYMGGNNMQLSPLALLRFAETWRAAGLWQGNRVLGGDWVRQSWRAHTRSPFSGDDYGYGWFLTRLGGQAMAYGRGYGGQLVCVVPGLALSIVITSDPNRPARSGGYMGDLRTFIARSIIEPAGLEG